MRNKYPGVSQGVRYLTILIQIGFNLLKGYQAAVFHVMQKRKRFNEFLSAKAVTSPESGWRFMCELENVSIVIKGL